MIITQLVFIVAGTSWFYYEFSMLLEQHIYSIHSLDLAVISQQINMLGLKIIAVYLAVNFFGLAVSDFIWVNFIKRVLGEFKELADKTKALDFSADNEESSHSVNLAAKIWRKHERERWITVQSQIKIIPSDPEQLLNNRELLTSEIKAICTELK